jgi:hypothetical protein
MLTARSRTATILVLVAAMASTAATCRRTNPDPASNVASDVSDVMKSTKVLIRTVTAAELTLSAEQKKRVAPVLDQFYLTAYQVGARGEQAADLLVTYKTATDVVKQGELSQRIGNTIALLQTDLGKLTGLDLTGLNSADVVKLVQAVVASVNTLRAEADKIGALRNPPQAARSLQLTLVS